MGSRESSRRSGSARVPGWTLGIIGLLVVGGILVLGYLAGRDPLPDSDASADFATLAPGQCLDVRVEGVPPDRVANDEAVRAAVALGDARAVACTQPHSHEVAETTGFDVGDAYPGDDFLIAIARPACAAGFESYVGRPLEGSSLGLVITVPDPASWQAGIRRAVCLVRKSDGTYATRPLRGSAQ